MIVSAQPIEIVSGKAYPLHGMVLIDQRDGVWLTFARPWWCVFAWLGWLLSSGPKRWIFFRTTDEPVRIRARRIARDYVRVGKAAK